MAETRTTQAAQGFLGVNLRKDRMTLADEELARAINADLHSRFGVVLRRQGRAVLFSALADREVRRLAFINGTRYVVAGQTLYREQVSMLTGLSAALQTTLLSARPLNDDVTWAFIADDALMRKDNGRAVSRWGLAAPTGVPTLHAGAGTGLTGAYRAVYTDVRFSGAAVAHESNPSPTPAALTLANTDLGLGDIAHPTDAQVTGLGVYRTVAGGVVPLLDARLAIPGTPSAAVTHEWEASVVPGALLHHWTIPLTGRRGTQAWEPTGAGPGEDAGGGRATHRWEIAEGLVTTQTLRWAFASSKADSALGSEVETDNDPPPLASWVNEFQGHAFLTSEPAFPHYLRFSKRFRPEAFPPDNFLEIGTPDDPLQCAVSLAGLLGVLTRRTKYRVTGTITSGFVAQEALSARGTPAPFAAIPTERGILFVARDGIFLTNLVASDEELSQTIAPLFFGETVNGFAPINWDAALTMAAASFQGRYYVSLPTGAALTPNLLAVYSRDTKRWYFYDHPCRSLSVELDNDQVVAGLMDGTAVALEQGDDDAGAAIAMEIETKDYFGGAVDRRKLFLWARLDADSDGVPLTVDLYVDDRLTRSVAVTTDRGRALMPFPEGSMGYTWRLRIRATTRQHPALYGVAAVFLPLEAA